MDLLQQLQDWFHRHSDQNPTFVVHQVRILDVQLVYTAILRTEEGMRVRVSGSDLRQALSRLMSNSDNLTMIPPTAERSAATSGHGHGVSFTLRGGKKVWFDCERESCEFPRCECKVMVPVDGKEVPPAEGG